MTAPYATAVVQAKLDWGNIDAEFETRVRAAVEKASKAAQKNLDKIKLAAKVSLNPKIAEFRTETQEKLDNVKNLHANVKLKADTSELVTKVAGMKSSLPKVEVSLEPKVSDTDFTKFVTDLRTRLVAANVEVPVTLTLNDAGYQARLRALTASPVNQRVNIIANGDSTRRTIEGLSGGPVRRIRMQIDLDRASVARAQAEVAAVEGRLTEARRRQTDATGRVAQAEARLAEVRARVTSTASQTLAAQNALSRAQHGAADASSRLTSLIGDQADAHRRLRRAQEDQNSMGRLARAGLGGVVEVIGDLGRNVSGMINPAGLARTALMALAAVSLVPLLGQLTQAAGVLALLPAMGAAAAAGLATVIIGSSGVFDAFSKGSKASDAAAKAAAAGSRQAEEDARKRASAARQVASAQRGVENAVDGVNRAERGVTTALRNAQKAQEAVNRAREDAKDTIDDLNFALKGTAIDERDAALALARAREQYDQTFADPGASALDRAEASLNIDKALRRQEEVGRQNTKIAKDAAEANKKGIEGSDQVVAAKEAVADADQGIVDANKAVIDAQEQLADAQQNLIDAQQAAAEATSDSTKELDEYELALANLSPKARDFVEKVRGLSEEWKALRTEVQDNLFDGLGDGVVELANVYLPILRTGFSGIATEINGGISRFFADLKTEHAQGNFKKIFENAQLAIGPLMDGLSSLGGALGNIAAIGSDFLPGLTGDFASLMQRFETWTSSEEGQNKIREFLRESMEAFGQIKDLFLAIGNVIGGIFKSSEESGKSMVESLTDSLNEFAAWMRSPEGQKEMRQFWDDVRTTVTDILTLVKEATVMASKIDEVYRLITGKPSKEEEDRQNQPPPVLDEQGNDGGKTGYGAGNPDAPKVTETDRSDSETSLGAVVAGSSDGTVWGKRFRDQNGDTVDKDGNRLRWQNNVIPGFPGVKAGSGADTAISFMVNKFAPFWGLRKYLGSDTVEGRAVAAGEGTGGVHIGTSTQDTLDRLNIPSGGGRSAGRAVTRDEWIALFGNAEEFDRIIAEQKAKQEQQLTDSESRFVTFGNNVTGVLDNLTAGGFSRFQDGLDEVAKKILGTTDDGQTNWGNLGTKIGDVVTDILAVPFPGLKTGLQGVGDFASAIVEGFNGNWAKLKGYAADPINWVIEHVLNGALKSAWNAVGKVLGLPEWEGVAPVDIGQSNDANKGGGFGKPMQGLYTGGIVPGYTPGRDTHQIAVGGGEAVMRPEWTRAMGPDYVDRMNAAARTRGVDGVRRQLTGYASGGIVQGGAYITSPIQQAMWDAVRTAFPQASLNSGTRTEDVGSGFDNHMAQRAIDLGGPMTEEARWIYQMNAKQPVLELIHAPLDGWQNLKDGAPLNYGAGTDADHYDHVHWAMDSMVNNDGRLVFAGGESLIDKAGRGMTSGFGAARSAAAFGLQQAVNAISSTIPTGDSLISQVPKAFFDKVTGAMIAKIGGGGATSGMTGNSPWDIGAGAEQWRPLVERLFREKGIDLGMVDKYLYQIQRESSGDPNAINLDDSNAQAGTPSKGLAQVIDPTFQSYKDAGFDNIWDPESNLRASLNYLLRDPKFGGQGVGALTGAGYDLGGLANGIGLMPKKILTPERVLSPEMTADFERLVKVLERPDFIEVLRSLDKAASDASSVTTAATTAANSMPAVTPAPAVAGASAATGPAGPAPMVAFNPNNKSYDPSFYGDTVARGGVEGANAWLARQDFGPAIRTWGINALKEIGGEFAEPVGLQSAWGGLVDRGASDAMKFANGQNGQGTTVINNTFNGFQGTPQQMIAEWERSQQQRMAPVTGTYRNG